jgi:hypothetical protein
MRRLLAAAGTVFCFLRAVECFSQATDTDLYAKARQLQNPLAVKTSITLLENILFNIGPEKKTGNALTFQPIVPVRINPEWNLLTQANLQLISLPSLNPEQGHINGLGDAIFYALLSPNRTTEWLWGIGPAFQIPTHTNANLGTDKWGLAPAAVVVRTVGKWVYGGIVNNTWSFAGREGASAINLFSLQYFLNYNFPSGWYFVSNGTITANWQATSSNQWTVPIGGGFGKVLTVAGESMNLQLQVFYNAAVPENGPNAIVQLSFQYVFR